MERKNDGPIQANNYINRSGCIYHSTYSGKGHDTADTDLKDVTITAKLKYVGSLISDKVASCTSKLVGNVSEILLNPSCKNSELKDDYFSEYDNYDEETKNEISQLDEDRLDEIDEKITMMESIFLEINSELYPSEPKSTGTQTNNGYSENDACTIENSNNCRHKVVIDEFPSHIDNNDTRFRPVSIIGPLLESLKGSLSATNDAEDKDSNLRSTILKWDKNQ